MNIFNELNFKIAWNQCRKYNYNNYKNFGIIKEIEFYDKYIYFIIKDIIKRINSMQYEFSYKYIVYIPKDNGLLRRISIATLEDQLVLQVILNYIGPKIDRKFIRNSYGNRIESKKGKKNLYIFKPYYIQFKKFSNSVIYDIEKGWNWVCETDITAYFDTINHNNLKEILNDHLNEDDKQQKYIKKLIIDFIKKGIIENGEKRCSHRGIPQSMQISSFLGNLFLDDVDKIMIDNKNIKYHRYVDDIRIMGKSKDEVKSALLNLQKLLIKKGLYINSGKTKIYNVNIDDLDKKEFKILQREKLSIDKVTENDFKDVRNYKKGDSNEVEFNELKKIIDKRNIGIKHLLIKKNEEKYFRYLEDMLVNQPKYYYLVQYVHQYKGKVPKERLNKLYEYLLHCQYDVGVSIK